MAYLSVWLSDYTDNYGHIRQIEDWMEYPSCHELIVNVIAYAMGLIRKSWLSSPSSSLE